MHAIKDINLMFGSCFLTLIWKEVNTDLYLKTLECHECFRLRTIFWQLQSKLKFAKDENFGPHNWPEGSGRGGGESDRRQDPDCLFE